MRHPSRFTNHAEREGGFWCSGLLLLTFSGSLVIIIARVQGILESTVIEPINLVFTPDVFLQAFYRHAWIL